MTARRPGGRALVALALGAVLMLSGCQFKGAASLPLPGGVGYGAGAYTVTAEFTDVLDLVPQSAVKVNDVTVGSVKAINLSGYTARVVMTIEKGVVLPANATASLRQTSLLGEKFVSLAPPVLEAPQGRLRSGAVIGLDRTTRSAEVEQVLGALSLVLNGGSLEQIQVINRELTAALQGREGKVRDVLIQLNTFIGTLDQQKQQIVRALDNLDKLTSQLAAQRQTLATALQDIPPGVSVLADQRAQLTKVLTGLNQLGQVATHVINASQQNTIADLKALQPILTQLNAAGTNLPNSLELLTTYPFPRTVDQGIKGDYANLFVTLDGNLTGTAGNLGLPVPSTPPLPVPVPTVPPLPVPVPSLPVPVPTLPGLAPSPSPGGLLPPVGGLTGIAAGSRADQSGILWLLLGGLS